MVIARPRTVPPLGTAWRLVDMALHGTPKRIFCARLLTLVRARDHRPGC